MKCYTHFKYYELVYNNYNFCASHAAYAVYKKKLYISLEVENLLVFKKILFSHVLHRS